jgi:peptide chain release factor subunit 1
MQEVAMLSESILQELLEINEENAVLSVYLNTEPSQGNADAYKLRLRHMLEQVNLPKDKEAVETYFNTQYDWSGKSVAVFSCAKLNLFRSYPLSIPILNAVHAGDRPGVRPLAHLLDNFGGYAVILVDKQGARYFYFHLGKLEEQDGYLGESVKRVKSGGASLTAGRGARLSQARHEDEVIERNMREAADAAVKFFEEFHVRRILIGGTDDNTASFLTLLPKSWRSLVVGTFAIQMTAGSDEVRNKAMEIGLQSEKKQEQHLVEQLLTRAAKADGAVIGLDDTLDAVNRHRVQVLVMAEGYHQTGYQCQECQMLTSQSGLKCTSCGGDMQTIPDVVEITVNSVIRHGGDVEVIMDDEDLVKAGSIGADLRY